MILKTFAVMLDVISGLFSVLAPLTVLHWILGIFDIDAIAGIMTVFDFLFAPFNLAIDTLASPFGGLPQIDYNDKKISITQGLLAVFFTFIFISLAFSAHLIRVLDKRLTLEKDISESKHRMAINEAQRTQAAQKVAASSRFLVYLIFPLSEYQKGASIFSSFKQTGGKPIQVTPTKPKDDSPQPEYAVLAFDHPLQALSYAITCAEQLTGYYATLRPMDPQPPFNMAIHAIEPNGQHTHSGFIMCEQLMRYSGDNQIIFSETVLEWLRINDKIDNYTYQSLGFYTLEALGADSAKQEIFRLFYKRPEQQVYY